MYQAISAVNYLHTKHQIAHRDIAPSNFVLSTHGRLILIDFGISIRGGTRERDEARGEMYFEVGTGPYRAPELLFASREYDPFAVDLWALGATLAEFFTAFETAKVSRSSSTSSSKSSVYSEDSNEDYEHGTSSGNIENGQDQIGKQRRRPLFDNGNGFSEFALIGSIFKILGTPTVESWPVRLLPSSSFGEVHNTETHKYLGSQRPP